MVVLTLRDGDVGPPPLDGPGGERETRCSSSAESAPPTAACSKRCSPPATRPRCAPTSASAACTSSRSGAAACGAAKAGIARLQRAPQAHPGAGVHGLQPGAGGPAQGRPAAAPGPRPDAGADARTRTSRRVLTDIRDRVKSGTDLSEAFAAHGDLFPRLYPSTLKAGERSGELEQVIRRFIRYMKLVLDARRRVVSALVYPAVLVVPVDRHDRHHGDLRGAQVHGLLRRARRRAAADHPDRAGVLRPSPTATGR